MGPLGPGPPPCGALSPLSSPYHAPSRALQTSLSVMPDCELISVLGGDVVALAVLLSRRLLSLPKLLLWLTALLVLFVLRMRDSGRGGVLKMVLGGKWCG